MQEFFFKSNSPWGRHRNFMSNRWSLREVRSRWKWGTARDCIANLEINRILNKIHESLAIASWAQEPVSAIT